MAFIEIEELIPLFDDRIRPKLPEHRTENRPVTRVMKLLNSNFIIKVEPCDRKDPTAGSTITLSQPVKGAYKMQTEIRTSHSVEQISAALCAAKPKTGGM
jgi:hypothetical protein